jgi:hypothetical protein
MGNFSFARLVTQAFEGLGLLNKGSAQAARPVPGAETPPPTPVSSSALNVTRVSGTAVLIAGAGAAGLALFRVDQQTDPHSLVITAWAGTSAIVVAALITAAIIISADLRARAHVAGNQTGDSPGTATAVAGSNVTKQQFADTWRHAIARLENAVSGLSDGGLAATAAWLDAAASEGSVKSLIPPVESADEHAKLTVAQDRVVERLLELVSGDDPTHWATVLQELRLIIGEMNRTIEDHAPPAS